MRNRSAVIALACLSLGASLPAQTTHAFRGDLLEAIVRFGFESRAPLAVEVRDWAALGREVDVAWSEDEPPCDALRRIVGEAPALSVEQAGGVCLVRPSWPAKNVLDTPIPDFGGQRSSLVMLDWALLRSLEHVLHPAPQQGFAGSFHILEGTPWLEPFDLDGKSVREILSALVTAAPGGGLWLADSNVQRGDALYPPPWRIVSYNQDRAYALQGLNELSRTRRRASAPRPGGRSPR